MSGISRKLAIASPKIHIVGPLFRRMIHRMQAHLTALKHATTITDELKNFPKSKRREEGNTNQNLWRALQLTCIHQCFDDIRSFEQAVIDHQIVVQEGEFAYVLGVQRIQ